jgi:hypothetical protein
MNNITERDVKAVMIGAVIGTTIFVLGMKAEIIYHYLF